MGGITLGLLIFRRRSPNSNSCNRRATADWSPPTAVPKFDDVLCVIAGGVKPGAPPPGAPVPSPVIALMTEGSVTKGPVGVGDVNSGAGVVSRNGPVPAGAGSEGIVPAPPVSIQPTSSGFTNGPDAVTAILSRRRWIAPAVDPPAVVPPPPGDPPMLRSPTRRCALTRHGSLYD